MRPMGASHCLAPAPSPLATLPDRRNLDERYVVSLIRA